MSYAYRRQSSATSSSRDFGGSYLTSSNLSNRSYGTGTSNSTTRAYEPYTPKYNITKSYSRPYAEPSSKLTYGDKGKYSLNNFDYKSTRPIIREPAYSPALKYSLTKFTDISPYSTYSSRHGSSSYLSDKESSKFPNSSLSSIDTTSISTSNSRNNRESSQRDVDCKEKNEPPKQSSYISRHRKAQYDTDNDEEVEKTKYDMISKTSRGTCTPNTPAEDQDGSLISRTRTRKYPKQNVRIEMGGTVLVGNLSQVCKDISTQTSDDIFLPSTRIRQSSFKSSSSKGSISTSSYYSKPAEPSKYIRPTRPTIRQLSIESPRSSTSKQEENIFFDNPPKQSPPKLSYNRKSTPVTLKDSIEKVNEWQNQNKMLENENSSARSPVPRSPNYYDLHAASKPHSRRRATISEENLCESETLTSSIVEFPKRKLSLVETEKLYVTKYTDFDTLLQTKFVVDNTPKTSINASVDDYNSNLDESPAQSHETTLIFSSKESKEIFNSMSIDLQHLVLKSRRSKIRFFDILEFCRNKNHMRKFTNEEERTFKGYSDLSEMLTDLGVDINKLENAVLQLCKFKENQVEYGPFLDFDLSLHEQHEDLDSFLDGGNLCVVLRTKLAVRVEALIEKINNTDGRELRRALFSLKQIFQDDKDLVQEFVARRGLYCLRQIGCKSDQNHQNYILRALGQLMLYVDGMNGVLEDPETIEWLYSLLQGKFRLVVKLALKLLVVFIEYAKKPAVHSSVIISAINEYHRKTGGEPWSLTMKILAEEDSTDSELVTYAITFINKVLSALPDQDTFYNVTDWLEEQGIEKISKDVLKKSNADVDMVKQFEIYETALKMEDNEQNVIIEHEGIRNLPRAKSETNLNGPRKSKRIQPIPENHVDDYVKTPNIIIDDQRKRIKRMETEPISTNLDDEDSDVDEEPTRKYNLRRSSVQPIIRIVPDSGESSPKNISQTQEFRRPSPAGEEKNVSQDNEFGDKVTNDVAKHSVKAMKSQFAAKTKTIEDSLIHVAPTGDSSGRITTAISAFQNIMDKPPMSSKNLHPELTKDPKINLSNDSPDWDKLGFECARKILKIKEWDFSNLQPSEDEVDSSLMNNSSLTNGVPPPPPPPPSMGRLPPAPPALCPPKPPSAPVLNKVPDNISMIPGAGKPKQKRTTKLHWRIHNPAFCDTKTSIWNKIKGVNFDPEKIELLFENKPHDLKKDLKHEVGPKKIEVLDVKRSNAINIGMTNLPPIPSIKSAILHMHTNIINREGVEKLLTTMLPTQEEIDNIKAAQINNKDAPLGQAETFLLELHEINLLRPRLEVWLYLLDFDQIERDIMESLMDLMQGIKEIYESKTLIYVLSTILTLGNFLNGSQVSSFSLDYLQKVPEVKDTKHKHSLLYHVVMIVRQEFPDSTDLHSDLCALNRCHRLDWEELSRKLQKIEVDCKRSWEHLRLIFKSDQTNVDVISKLKKFYWEASETIVKMEIIHRRVMKRFEKVLEYLGFPRRESQEMKVRQFCRTISDFAIEYRTTREKFDQLEEKKIKDKERKKTRGAMIGDISINSLDRSKRNSLSQDNDLMSVIMSRTSVGNSDCENDFNSLNLRRARRSTQNNIPIDGLKGLSRPLSTHQLRNQDSSPGASNMTAAVSELSLDQSDPLLDKLAQKATSSENKRRTGRRSCARDRKSMRRTKPNIDEDIIRNLLEIPQTAL